MSDFNQAIGTILLHEGGYSNRPDDTGGPTNYGISLKYLKSLSLGEDVSEKDIQQIDKQQAIAIYKKEFWDKYGYGNINDQGVATKVFDMAVNMGPRRAHKLLQIAILRCSDVALIVDGVLGGKTFYGVDAADPENLLNALCELSANFYRSLNQPKFIKGWLKRAYS